jgi:hypothetical protein
MDGYVSAGADRPRQAADALHERRRIPRRAQVRDRQVHKLDAIRRAELWLRLEAQFALLVRSQGRNQDRDTLLPQPLHFHVKPVTASRSRDDGQAAACVKWHSVNDRLPLRVPVDF